MNQTYKYILLFAIIGFLTACENNTSKLLMEPSEEEPSAIILDQIQFEKSKFELGKISQQSFSKSINATGTIKIPEKSKAIVSTLMSGTVGAINLVEGQWVRRGQQLFTVTNPEVINLQEEYLIANSQLEYLKEAYSRQKELSADNLTTKRELLRVKSELNVTQARQGALSKKLTLYGINTENLGTNNLVSSLSVRAPISGYVSKINAIQGAFIDPNEAAVELMNTAQMYLSLTVLERHTSQLVSGQQVKFSIQGNPTQTYIAKVQIITKSINENHMIVVNCAIDDEQIKELVPGMYVNASLVLDNYQANALPAEALVKVKGDYFALLLKDKNEATMSFDKVQVTVGENLNGYLEVKEQNLDNQYLTKGAYFLVQ